MNCSGCSEQLHDYIDGELTSDAMQALEAHLVSCADCQRALDSLRALRTATAALERDIAPSRDLWSGIAPQLNASGKLTRFPASRPRFASVFLPLAAAAAIAFAIVLAQHALAPRGAAWNVASVDGTPRVDAEALQGAGRLHVGQWLETDQSSRAKVEVGAIGEVNVEPNSRLRLVDASATDHRLELARGEMRALIWAPPRLFFVDTPSATAVDLGCAYTLKVDDRGAGMLRVTLGWVALAHDGDETIIPHGQACLTRRGASPGTPFAVDAPESLQRALERFDFDVPAGRPAALAEVLAQARPDDYVMLWHLLSRAAPAQRGAVFDVLAKDHPAPASVTRAGVIAGNVAMRQAWGDALGLRSFAPTTKVQ